MTPFKVKCTIGDGTQYVALRKYEELEIETYRIYEIYFWGRKTKENEVGAKKISRCFINHNESYKINCGDHILYRYEILENLGTGGYGMVARCFDHKEGTVVAIKVTLEESNDTHGKDEIKIMKFLHDKYESTDKIVKLKNTFIFRHHTFIVMECLGVDLATRLKEYVRGLLPKKLKALVRSLLQCLHLLHLNHIYHGDIKSSNIVLHNDNSVKIIDFGYSKFEWNCRNEKIQTRCYRAPEVELGIPYYRQIDMWSVGCTVYELLTGQSFIEGPFDIIETAMYIIGNPRLELAQKWYRMSAKARSYFKASGLRKSVHQRRPSNSRFNRSRPQNIDKLLRNYTDIACKDFIKKCLVWNPDERMSCLQALEHRWLMDNEIPHIDTDVIFLYYPSENAKKSNSLPVLFVHRFPDYFRNSCKQLNVRTPIFEIKPTTSEIYFRRKE